jgi:hypothetical protein
MARNTTNFPNEGGIVLFISTQVILMSGQQVTAYYLTEEGKRKLESLNDLSKRVDLALEKIDKITAELIETFFLERMQFHIIESLKLSPKTQQMVAKNLPDFSKNSMTYHAFYEAWEKFEKSGVIVPTSHGRGHPRTWKVNYPRINSRACFEVEKNDSKRLVG